MKSYCYLPWTRIKIDANGDYQSCCHQSNYYGNLIKENLSIEDAFKSQQLREVKVATLNRTLHEGCNNKQCPHYFKSLERNIEVTLNKYPDQIELNLPSTWCNIGGLNPTPDTTCIMCPRSSVSYMKSQEGIDSTEELLDKIRPVIPHVKSFTVLGIAEPFWKGRVFEILDAVDWRAHMEGKWFWTYSNATIFGKKFQDLFLNEYTTHSSIGFSVDAASPETYIKIRRLDYYNTVQRNLEMYFNAVSKMEAGRDKSFTTYNINILNLHEMEDTLRFSNSIGAERVQYSLTYESVPGIALSNDLLCNENNWQLFWEKQQRVEQLAKELNQQVEFYYPFHNGYLKD
jgi:hypothetical protein